MSVQEADLHQLALNILLKAPVRIPTLKEVEQADAVLVLGEDVLNTSPRLALSLRQTAANIGKTIAEKLRVPLWQDAAIREARQDQKTPVYLATLSSTGIDDIAAETFKGTPEAIARLGAAIAHAIDPAAPAVDGLDENTAALIQRIVDTLKAASKPLVISGTGCFSPAVMQAAANIAQALANCASDEQGGRNECTDLYLCVPESNSMGMAMLHEETAQGGSLQAALQRVESDRAVVQQPGAANCCGSPFA